MAYGDIISNIHTNKSQYRESNGVETVHAAVVLRDSNTKGSAAINYLKPSRVYCNQPNLGKGFVQTEHGKLSVPSPAVIELLSKTNIKVSASFDSIEAELSTPTGIALIANIVDSYQLPRSYSIKSYGVGLGVDYLLEY